MFSGQCENGTKVTLLRQALFCEKFTRNSGHSKEKTNSGYCLFKRMLPARNFCENFASRIGQDSVPGIVRIDVIKGELFTQKAMLVL